MSCRDLVIVATQVANVASVRALLNRIGHSFSMSADPERVLDASHVILPGVGAFASAMEVLKERNLVRVLGQRLVANRPTLGICLGMQVMGLGSQESLDCPGLGFVDCVATRFQGAPTSVHMGWNRVEGPVSSRVIGSGYAYFSHSYSWKPNKECSRYAWSRYGQSFAAGFEQGNIVGCQFHPELSGAWGAGLVRRFLDLEVPC